MFDETIKDAIKNAASELQVETAALMAVVHVESGGRAFAKVHGRDLPLIRWEGHYFYRHLPPELRPEAIRRKLAATSGSAWGQIKNPQSQEARYNLLERAKKLHPEAAYSSCSWGVGQVMGANWQWLGRRSAAALAEESMSGIQGQLSVMASFIAKRGLVDELQARDFRAFARAYNGSGQVDFYATKMKNAYSRFGGTQENTRRGQLRIGSRGDEVRELQQKLRQAGYALHVDGDFGTGTRAVVMQFQRDFMLEASGVADPMMRAVLDSAVGS